MTHLNKSALKVRGFKNTELIKPANTKEVSMLTPFQHASLIGACNSNIQLKLFLRKNEH